VTSAREAADTRDNSGPLVSEIHGEEAVAMVHGVDWIVLPSTPTTNYPLGLKLSYGLTGTFHQYVANLLTGASPARERPAGERKPVLLGIAHTGLQEDGESIVEASMLHNRFALNTDASKSYASHSSRLIYERLLLPRLVEDPSALWYIGSGLAARDEAGIPLYRNGSRARRIKPEAVEQIPLLKMFAHSSGITTAQQLDNLMRSDMDRLGFLHDEQRAVYDKSVVISFASASDVHANCLGAPVIDVTAFNDIRSLAGTTTNEYLFSTPDEKVRMEEVLHAARTQGLQEKYSYIHATPLLKRRGKHGKTVLRLRDVFLLDDPARMHDGHSIKKYLENSPAFLRHWIATIHHAPRTASANALIEELYGHHLNPAM
jgi:hypothetical protein